MAFVSWLYDHAAVHDVTYDDTVRVEFTAPPAVVRQARGRVPD